MPVLSREDAADVEKQITRIFSASDDQRPDQLRRLFVEKLDFSPASVTVSLAKARKGSRRIYVGTMITLNQVPQ